MTREASTKLRAIQPVLEVENDTFIVTPASTRWVRGSLQGDTPLSDGELSDLNAAGINVEEVAVGSCLYEHYIEPTYRSDTEEVLIKAAYKRLIEVPAVFTKKQDRVLVEAAHSIWQKGTGPIQKIDNQTGEIMCRVGRFRGSNL